MSRETDRGPDPIDIHVGQRITHLRERANLTQTDLGDAIGVTFQQVQKYEKGANRVSASRLFKIAEFLDCDIETFFPPHNQATTVEDSAIDALMSSRSGHALMQLFVTLSGDQRRALLVVARAFTATSKDGDSEVDDA